MGGARILWCYVKRKPDEPLILRIILPRLQANNNPIIPTLTVPAPTHPCWDKASDDVMVKSMRVMILDEEGNAVEKGEGIRAKGDWWEYMPTAEGKLVVEARDLAGNVVREDMNT